MPPPLHPSTVRAVSQDTPLPHITSATYPGSYRLSLPQPSSSELRVSHTLALQSWCAQRCPVMNDHLQVRLRQLVPYVLPSAGAGSQQRRSEMEGGILGESGCATDSLCNPDKGSCPL